MSQNSISKQWSRSNYNLVLRTHHTLRRRLPLGHYLGNAEVMLNCWCVDRTKHKIYKDNIEVTYLILFLLADTQVSKYVINVEFYNVFLHSKNPKNPKSGVWVVAK